MILMKDVSGLAPLDQSFFCENPAISAKGARFLMDNAPSNNKEL